MEYAEEAAARAVARGEHPDPFSYLGMHEEGEGRLVVRAFVPDAGSVSVIAEDGRPLGELEPAGAEGLFAGPVETEGRVAYRLRARNDGGEWELEDSYRFPPVVSDYDLYLFGEGNHLGLYEWMGAHVREVEGVRGVLFAVWAPNASRVSVVGDFNAWDGRRHAMRKHHSVGVWEIFVPGLGGGESYKYEIKGPTGNFMPLKADPFGMRAEKLPGTSSVVHDPSGYSWGDAEWMENRLQKNAHDAPISVYEVHLGSWRRNEDGTYLSYDQLSDQLVSYVGEMGYTHVEFLPPTEYPFDGSWGYQPLGLFAPTSRYGSPDDFKNLVDSFHRAGIGVLMDWVPAHFPEDPHGLAFFDGTHLYEHADPRRGRHADWGTLVFNFGRSEVQNYLLANALFWLSEYHIDGLRVDAVASMLYLDYSREEGQWVPNEFGGNEDLDAVAFLKHLNETVYAEHAETQTYAEESTAWPRVSGPVHAGGLGFGYKWNMGWMHDTLDYMSEDPINRRFHHDKLTFGLVYAFNENFVLPLSHDEVVHGKGSLINKMPGDEWQRFANLRAYYGFMYGHPGKSLLFMGGEFAQGKEWNHDIGLDWDLLDNHYHAGVSALVRDLNGLYRSTPALHEVDFEPRGFEWVEGGDSENSVFAFLRHDRDGEGHALVVCNMTPIVREGYKVGVPGEGTYDEVLNTDSEAYGGSGVGNGGPVVVEAVPTQGRDYSLSLTLPPLSTIILKPVS